MSGEAAGLRQLAVHLRGVAARLEVQRASMGPAALTWWQGPGADAHRQRVAERRTALAALADELVQAAREADELADHVAVGAGRGGAP